MLVLSGVVGAGILALSTSLSRRTCDRARVHGHVFFHLQVSRFLMSTVTVAIYWSMWPLCFFLFPITVNEFLQNCWEVKRFTTDYLPFSLTELSKCINSSLPWVHIFIAPAGPWSFFPFTFLPQPFSLPFPLCSAFRIGLGSTTLSDTLQTGRWKCPESCVKYIYGCLCKYSCLVINEYKWSTTFVAWNVDLLHESRY